MTPRQKAEACFALARSTTHPGERANAISRGEAICARNGFALDDFDIPGRVRTQRPTGPSPAPPRSHNPWAPQRYDTFEAVRAQMERFQRSMFEAEFAAAARPGESAYDARRRNFNQAADEAKARDLAHDLALALGALRKCGAHPLKVEGEGWAVLRGGERVTMTDRELIRFSFEMPDGLFREDAA